MGAPTRRIGRTLSTPLPSGAAKEAVVLFWIIAALVVVVGFALAWWSSGRAKPGRTDRGRAVSDGTDQGKTEAAANRLRNGNGTLGGF